MTLDDRDKWRAERPELHVRLDGDEMALIRALRAAGITQFEITHSSPQCWKRDKAYLRAVDAAANVEAAQKRLDKAREAQKQAVDVAAKSFTAGVPGAGEAAKIGLDLANRTIAYAGREAAKCCTGLGGPVDIDLTPRVGQGGGVTGSPKPDREWIEFDRPWWKRLFRA